MVRYVNRYARYMVGPFTSWVLRGEYVKLIVPETDVERLKGLGIRFLDVPIRKIQRAYIDVRGRVWLLVSRMPYDLVKHFTGYPEKIRRRLAALWCYRCCTDQYTGLGRIPICFACGGDPSPVIFWQDPGAVRALVGPCRIGRRACLICDSRKYYPGEILSIHRDQIGNLYAEVLTLKPPESQASDLRLVDVESLPELGWRKPVILV